MLVRCTQTYLDTQRIVEGTTAEVVSRLDGVQLRIKHAAFEGNEVHPGEVVHLTTADFQRLWTPLPQPAPLTDGYGDDRGKQLQRHPADPGPEWG